MSKEINRVLKKTVKIAGVTCVALGGAALIASGAALKALAEGAKFVKNTVKEILDEQPAEEPAEVVEAEAVEAEAVEAEAVEPAQQPEEAEAEEETVTM